MTENRHLPVPSLLVAGVFAFTIILIVTILGAQHGGFGDLLKTGPPSQGTKLKGTVEQVNVPVRVGNRQLVATIVRVKKVEVNGRDRRPGRDFRFAALVLDRRVRFVDRNNQVVSPEFAPGDKVTVRGRRAQRVLNNQTRLFQATSVKNRSLPRPPPDTTPPTISNVQVTNLTATGATITWTTNELSDSTVDYGLTAGPPYENATADPTLVTSHSITITGLTAGTTYHYSAASEDAAGNEATTPDATFATGGAPPPPPPPPPPAQPWALERIDLSVPELRCPECPVDQWGTTLVNVPVGPDNGANALSARVDLSQADSPPTEAHLCVRISPGGVPCIDPNIGSTDDRPYSGITANLIGRGGTISGDGESNDQKLAMRSEPWEYLLDLIPWPYIVHAAVAPPPPPPNPGFCKRRGEDPSQVLCTVRWQGSDQGWSFDDFRAGAIGGVNPVFYSLVVNGAGETPRFRRLTVGTWFRIPGFPAGTLP